MISQLQVVSTPIQNQPANCKNCKGSKYLYECSLCQFEYCRDCAKAVQMSGNLYVICEWCKNAIVARWNGN
jgi:hypothetical protein